MASGRTSCGVILLTIALGAPWAEAPADPPPAPRGGAWSSGASASNGSGSESSGSSSRSRKRKPGVQFSGQFALRFVYDDNILHYSAEELLEFESTSVPGKYSITTAGDWIVRPRLELTATTKALTGEKLETRLRLSSWRYVENGIKNNESFALRLKHPGSGKDNFQLEFYHAPWAYLRNYRDRPPFMSRATPLEYTDFSYTSTSAALGYWRRLSKKWDGKLELKRAWRYYNQPFMENDNWEWRYRGYLGCRMVKWLKVTGEYYYASIRARAADEAGERAADSDNGDYSHVRDSYKITLTFYVPKGFLKLSNFSFSGQYQAFYFTTRRPVEEDPYHVGRKDEIRRFEFTCSSRPITKSISLEGGYRYTRRNSSAAWQGSEGESIDEDKNYRDNRFWFGAAHRF